MSLLCSKQLTKSSRKAEKEEASEKLRVKTAIEKGNIDVAKVYAQVLVLFFPSVRGIYESCWPSDQRNLHPSNGQLVLGSTAWATATSKIC